jgi:hypothetical protein
MQTSVRSGKLAPRRKPEPYPIPPEIVESSVNVASVGLDPRCRRGRRCDVRVGESRRSSPRRCPARRDAVIGLVGPERDQGRAARTSGKSCVAQPPDTFDARPDRGHNHVNHRGHPAPLGPHPLARRHRTRAGRALRPASAGTARPTSGWPTTPGCSSRAGREPPTWSWKRRALALTRRNSPAPIPATCTAVTTCGTSASSSSAKAPRTSDTKLQHPQAGWRSRWRGPAVSRSAGRTRSSWLRELMPSLVKTLRGPEAGRAPAPTEHPVQSCAGALLAAVTTGWVRRVRRQGRGYRCGPRVGRRDHRLRGGGLAAPALALLAVAGCADVISAVFRTTIIQLAAPDALRAPDGPQMAVVWLPAFSRQKTPAAGEGPVPAPAAAAS